MSQDNLGKKTFTSAGAIGVFELVSLSTGNVIQCEADTVPIGVAMDDVTASGAYLAIDLLNTGGTKKIKAGAAISLGAACYEGADGKLAASGDTVVGTALEAATADGDIIEVLVA